MTFTTKEVFMTEKKKKLAATNEGETMAEEEKWRYWLRKKDGGSD
jgi:hypothetical protein